MPNTDHVDPQGFEVIDSRIGLNFQQFEFRTFINEGGVMPWAGKDDPNNSCVYCIQRGVMIFRKLNSSAIIFDHTKFNLTEIMPRA